MRHLGSILLAVLAAPLGLLLAGRGLVGLAEAAEADRTDLFGIVASASALGLAGLILAVLTLARLSPLGPALAGAGYLVVGVWALDDRAGFLDTVRGDLVGLTDEQVLAGAAIAPLLAVPMLVTFGMPSRWRRKAKLAAAQPGLAQPGPARSPAGPVAAPAPSTGVTTHTLDDLPRVPPLPPQPAPPPYVPPAPPPVFHPPPPAHGPPSPFTRAFQQTYPQAGQIHTDHRGDLGGVHGVPTEEVTVNYRTDETTAPLTTRQTGTTPGHPDPRHQ